MILLSFDTEECDVPREHGVQFSFEEGMEVSVYGTERILDILEKENVHATFFCTANFAAAAPRIIERIVAAGHEVASHGCDHWKPDTSDVRRSKEILEGITGMPCKGYRQPRMFPVSNAEIRECGYVYNSSLNPAFIPGRYMHLSTPRTAFVEDGVLQIPASVTPLLRIPLFWLSLHNFPEWLYLALAGRVLGHDGYFMTYFHPWEFYELGVHPEFKLPFIIRNHSGKEMEHRLERLIRSFKERGENFVTFSEFAEKELVGVNGR